MFARGGGPEVADAASNRREWPEADIDASIGLFNGTCWSLFVASLQLTARKLNFAEVQPGSRSWHRGNVNSLVDRSKKWDSS